MSCFSFIKRSRLSPPGGVVEIDEEVSSIQNTKLYTYKELKVATQDFCYANKLGEGGFGTVYKGTLKDGTVVAVKLLSPESKQGIKEFLTEIDVIAEIEHENLVKLYGCCVEGKHRILVYGYVENNSLAQTLLGGSRSNIQFSWRARRGICIGVAKGLAYLHEEVQPRIVHRDIKASNVLLDKYLEPKISDFGLAKLFPANMTHISTKVAGTAGYLAPEYALQGRLSRKADVYSFGVLLLEIICGKCNTNRRLPSEDRYLLERVWRHHEQGKVVELVDFAMNGDFDAEEAANYLKIGLLCTQDAQKLRPSMSKVVKLLMNEIDVNEEKIAKPGILSEFMGVVNLGETTTNTKDSSESRGTTTEEGNVSSSSEEMSNSYAAMTFSSIYDRR